MDTQHAEADVLTATMTERTLQDAIVAAARRLHWFVYFTWRSDHSPAGFPDLFLLKGERSLAYELKTATGRVSAEQQAWIDALNDAGIPARVVRPSDLDDILAELAHVRTVTARREETT